MAEPSVTLFGPLDAVFAPYVEYAVFVLVLVTFVTRRLETKTNREQASEGDADALSRHPVHWVAVWGLVLMSFYYLTLHHHAGIVLSTLVVGMFITDFFEFEVRKVNVREGRDIERPDSAIVAATLVFLYSAFLSVFFLVDQYWNLIV